MRAFLKGVVIAFAISSTLLGEAQAKHCPRCEKIENERTQEAEYGAKTPEYYDDYISLTTPQDQSTSSGSMQYGSSETSAGTITNDPNVPSRQKDSLKRATNTGSTIIDSTSFDTREASSRGFAQDNSEMYGLRTPESQSQSFSTVFVILQSKDFIRTLSGPFTLFVPSNDAFRRLPPGMLQDLLRPENQNKLSNLISNHVVASKIDTKDLMATKVKSVGGKDLDVRIDTNGVMTVNGAHVLKSENVGSNGMIYVIDRVLN